MTTVEPTSADGYYYIPLGIMTSATAGKFISSSRLYAYADGAFGPIDLAAKELTAVSVINQYYLSTSPTEQEGGEWTDEKDFTLSEDATGYLWVRTKIVRDTGDPDYTQPYLDSVFGYSKANLQTLSDSIVAEVENRKAAGGELQTQITQVKTTAEEFSVWHTTAAQTEMNDAANAAVQAYDAQVQNYMRYDGTANELTLGQVGSGFKAKLSNTRLAFTGADGNDAAWISNNQLNINEAVIEKDIQMTATNGKWMQQVVNNHFQIKWVSN